MTTPAGSFQCPTLAAKSLYVTTASCRDAFPAEMCEKAHRRGPCITHQRVSTTCNCGAPRPRSCHVPTSLRKPEMPKVNACSESRSDSESPEKA